MNAYSTNIRLKDAGTTDYERLDKEMETQLFEKLRGKAGYHYRGGRSSAGSDVTAYHCRNYRQGIQFYDHQAKRRPITKQVDKAILGYRHDRSSRARCRSGFLRAGGKFCGESGVGGAYQRPSVAEDGFVEIKSGGFQDALASKFAVFVDGAPAEASGVGAYIGSYEDTVGRQEKGKMAGAMTGSIDDLNSTLAADGKDLPVGEPASDAEGFDSAAATDKQLIDQ